MGKDKNDDKMPNTSALNVDNLIKILDNPNNTFIESINNKLEIFVKKYQVGTYKELQGISPPGDLIDLHHVPASAWMKKHFPDIYKHSNGYVIALPKEMHTHFHKSIGYKPDLNLEFNQILAQYVYQLRNSSNYEIPNDTLRKIIYDNVKEYPGHFNERTVRRAMEYDNKMTATNSAQPKDSSNNIKSEGKVNTSRHSEHIAGFARFCPSRLHFADFQMDE